MPSLAAVASQLLAGPPRPVICLDTCDILEVVQCLDWEKERTPRPVRCIDAARRLLTAVAIDPFRAQLVITDLVHWEWHQTAQIHHELAPELSDPAVRITFFIALDAALGALGI